MKNILKLIAGWVIAFGLAYFGVEIWWRLTPPQANPFAPLSLADEIGVTTKGKLAGLKDAPGACFAALDAAEVAYTALPQSDPGQDCGFYDALTVDQTLTPYSARISVTCPMAAALYIWERHVARPAAEEIFGAPLARIETFGTYACRRVNNATRGRFSQHATANAIDISGFVLDDGRRIRVQTHWKDGAEGRFLKRVRDGGCRLFSVVLGPDYNARHKDHFHFDLGRGRVCR